MSENRLRQCPCCNAWVEWLKVEPFHSAPYLEVVRNRLHHKDCLYWEAKP